MYPERKIGPIQRFILFSIALVCLTYVVVSQIKPPYSELSDQIQPQFKPLVYNFLQEAKKHPLPPEFEKRLAELTVKFGDVKKIDAELAGYCDTHTTTVIIDPNPWKNYQIGTQQAMIDHELGHCLLQRIHRRVFENTNPVSIMFPYAVPSEFFLVNKEKLYAELFSPNRYNMLPYAQDLINKNTALLPRFNNEKSYIAFVEGVVNEDIPNEIPPKHQQSVSFEDDPMVVTATPKKRVDQ